ncbi:ATP synthase subunit I [Culicoidibacter larvae]|uniref:ATP synthase subunit I n=1 Tax=Culicoidibacter larvae TaxID=2579976 RepID=A0A5R8QGK4_9FIRM|nr:ATP synthase subunit I [Culicoidibacter larvae]TLG77102.1 hypothetical protein FEZ08_00355 [Culicoidibacter larvae]
MFSQEKEIKYPFIIIAAYGIIIAGISLIFWPAENVVLGILLGTVVSLLNLTQLYRALKRAVEQQNSSAVSGSLFLRLLLIVLGAVACWFLPMIFNPFAYIVGILIYPLAMKTTIFVIWLQGKFQGGVT